MRTGCKRAAPASSISLPPGLCRAPACRCCMPHLQQDTRVSTAKHCNISLPFMSTAIWAVARPATCRPAGHANCTRQGSNCTPAVPLCMALCNAQCSPEFALAELLRLHVCLRTNAAACGVRGPCRAHVRVYKASQGRSGRCCDINAALSPASPICNASGCMPSASTEADPEPLLPACTVPASLHNFHLWQRGMQPACICLVFHAPPHLPITITSAPADSSAPFSTSP